VQIQKRKEREEQRINKSGKGRLALTAILTSFLAAGGLFLLLMQSEKKMLENYQTRTVYVVKKAIPAGTGIFLEHPEEYLEERELDAELVGQSILTAENRKEELIARFTIREGTILYEEMFETPEEILEAYKEPVIAGFRGEDLYQLVGGILRPGDRIHVYSVEKESGSAKLLWSDLYVKQVFDNSGKRIDGEDGDASALRINIYLDKGDVEAFYEGLFAGQLRVVKAL